MNLKTIQMKQTFNLTIDGYWREENISGIPSHSGVYFVYTCTYNKSERTVSLQKLIYIGESGDVNDRLASHEKWPDWRKYLGDGEEICISTCPVPSASRNRVEAAYIFKHKPPVNTDYKNSFPFDETTINSSGKTRLLYTHFTVYRT